MLLEPFLLAAFVYRTNKLTMLAAIAISFSPTNPLESAYR